MGDRAGNWAVQNADLILAVGTRISIRQVGYNWESWARAAEVIMVDIDQAELRKPTLHVELPVWADAKDFLTKLDQMATSPVNTSAAWRETCQRWKKEYPVVLPRYWEENGETANVYAFMRHLSGHLPERSLTAVSNGACCVVGNQAYVIQKGSRMANNSAIASMGYGLPAAIGTCLGGGHRTTICLEGDGSIMMNLQELQTILTNNLPIKIFLINNNGYHSIRITQGNLFSHHTKVGIDPESNDLSFPSFERLAGAFGYRYLSAHSNAEMIAVVDEALRIDGCIFCEIFTDTNQVWEPKSSTKRLPDGADAVVEGHYGGRVHHHHAGVNGPGSGTAGRYPFRCGCRTSCVGGVHRCCHRKPHPRPVHHHLYSGHFPLDAKENTTVEQCGGQIRAQGPPERATSD